MISALSRSVQEHAARRQDRAIALGRRLFDHPELAFEEHLASATLAELLTEEGYRVQRGVGGLDTALVAEHGTGALVVGLCAEYDALPDIGHACGHNVIAGAAALAALALAPYVDELDITLRLFGTPAEERGGGKVLMLERGVFDGTDAVLMVHPAPVDTVSPTIVAVTRLDVEFRGETPPSMFPERGRNAGAASTLMEVAVALARQTLRADERVSGVVLSAGHSPNVVPDRASSSYTLRAGSDERLAALVEQLERCARGAALATGTDVTVAEPDPRYGALREHAGLAAFYRRNAEHVGRRFAPATADDAQRAAGSDFGNLSAVMAAIHPLIGVEAHGASNHQAEFAVACGGPEGDRAIRDGGTALAMTIVDLATDPQLRSELIGRRNS